MSHTALYEHYVEEVRSAFQTVNDTEDLTGFCDTAAPLFSFILKTFHGLEVEVISGAVETEDERKGHYWNRHNGVALDVTADQFGLDYGIVPEEVLDEYYVGHKPVQLPLSDYIVSRYIIHIQKYKG